MRSVRQAMQQAKFAPEAWPVVQATALAELVNRRLVLAYARRTGTEPDPRRVDARVAERKASGSAAGKGPEDEAADASEEALVREAAWGLAWEAYLRRYRTDARIAAYFEEHRREFDGTELEVRHILLRPSPGDRQAAKALVERAQAIRAEILSGKITFEEAARRYSAGPSARRRMVGGDPAARGDGRVVLPRRLRAEGGRDQRRGAESVWRSPHSLRRSTARRKIVAGRKTRDRRRTGGGTPGADRRSGAAAHGGGVHGRVAPFRVRRPNDRRAARDEGSRGVTPRRLTRSAHGGGRDGRCPVRRPAHGPGSGRVRRRDEACAPVPRVGRRTTEKR